jgi:hypothetical protein
MTGWRTGQENEINRTAPKDLTALRAENDL